MSAALLADAVIRTPRLILRGWREDDRPAFHGLLNTPAVTRWLGGVRDAAHMDALFDKRMADQARDGHCYWAVALAGTGALIGTCGLRRAVNYPGKPVAGMMEAGWRFGEAFWGQGYAREAARASIAWGWANTSAPWIGAWTTQENVPSWQLMLGIGMVRAPMLDFDRPAPPDGKTIERQLVHLILRPETKP